MHFVINIYKTFKPFKFKSFYNENIINNCITIAIKIPCVPLDLTYLNSDRHSCMDLKNAPYFTR